MELIKKKNNNSRKYDNDPEVNKRKEVKERKVKRDAQKLRYCNRSMILSTFIAKLEKCLGNINQKS